MIKYIFFLFLFSAGLFSPLEAIASGGYTYTHTTPALELKPISSLDNSYQTAAVCFLGVGDCQQGGYDKGDDDMDSDSAKQCQNDGFIRNNCNAVQIPENICIHNGNYIEKCKCKPDLVTCTSPKFGVGLSCGGKYASCQCPATISMSYPNDTCTQKCDGNCIAKTCTKTANEPSCRYGTQSCSDGCGGNTRSCCRPCSPASSETGCSYGTETCGDGCGGYRSCCKAEPPCNYCSVHGNCHGDCCRDGSIASCDSRCGGSGCYTPPPTPPTPPANPWRYVRSNCRSLMCWNCLNQQYCGSYYQTGYAPTYTCDNHCVNSSTGAKNYICSLQGYGIFSAKAATKAQCISNMAGLTPPSGESNAGTCNADGTSSCHY